MTRRLASLMLLAALLAGCSAGSTPAPSSLPAGTYTSKAFQPPVTYTVPTGWDNPNDTADYYDIVPAGSNLGGIFLFRDPRPASQDASCPASPAPSIIAGSSTTLMSWIRGRPGFTVSLPKLVTVGGLPGVEVDVAIKAGWATSCPFANGIPAVPLFVFPGSDHPWTVAGTERLRLDILDLPGGKGTVVVDIDAFDGSIFDELVSQAAPIVQSMKFATS